MTNADNFGYYEKRYFGKYNYAFSSRATLTLNTRYFNSELGYGKTEYAPYTDITMLGQTFLVGPVLKVNITPSWDIRAGGYFRNLTGTYYNWGTRTDTLHNPVTGLDSIADSYTGGVWKTSSNDWQIDAQSTLKLEKFGTFTAGFDLLDNAINFGPRYDAIKGDLLKDTYGANKAMINGGLYVQDELRLWERFITVAGLRLDYNSIFGIVPCPRLGIIYKQNPMFRLKVSAGRAFRAPSLAELYMPAMPINTSTTLLPDSSLKPEYIWSVDGGPEIDIMKWMSLRISGFYNSMDDLVTQKVVNEYFQNIWLDTKLSHKNTEKAWSAGLENSLELRLDKWGSFFFNYTYTKSEDMQMHGKLEYIPEHQFNTGVYVKKSFGPITLSGSLLGNFVGRRDYLDWRVTLDSMQAGKIPLPPTPSDFNPSFVTLPGYFRIDVSAKITYKDFVWLGVEGLNITQEEIEELSGTYAPKRFIAARIGLQF
jgi:outer membrane cobalamin receptor